MQDFAGSKMLVAAGAVAGRIHTAYEPMGKPLGRQMVRVMKLTLLFITVGLLQANANGYSQQLTMDVKDESLIRVFAIIKKQTGYVYFGATELLSKAKPVTFKVRNEPLDNVLRLCFRDQPLDYVIDGKTISVFEKKKEPGITISSGSPALIDLRGRVTNEQNEAVAGVSVMVKGTKTGTYTDGDGVFVLSKVPSDAVLVLTAVNIQSIEAPISGRRVLELKVKGKTGKLDEVQVIAYGKTSQRFNLGNVTTVKAEDIEKQPVQNPLLALQGRVPGLEVTQLTGMNGGGVRVRIQGRNSIGSGLDPLIVIDGVPFPSQLELTNMEGFLQGGSPLSYINPSDIESISILKDADATAIYGSRAANGAILITTKKGKIGKTELNINLQQGWGKVTRKVDMLNTRQYLDMRYEAYRNDGIDWMRPNVTANDLKLWDTTRYTDWQKTLIGGTAKYTNISANVSGGTPTVQYIVGATYNRQTTVFPDNFDDQRGAVNLSLKGNSANQKFRIGVSAQYMYDKNRLPGVDLTDFAVRAIPNAPPLYNADGTLNWAVNAAGNSTWDNPLQHTQNFNFSNATRNLVSNLQVGYILLPGLSIRSSVGYTNLQSDLNTRVLLEYYRPEQRASSQRLARRGFRTMNTWIIEPQLEYNGRLGKGKIESLLGATAQQSTGDVLHILGLGYNSNFLLESFTQARSIQILASGGSMYRYNALFGRLNYSWQDKYLLGLTARRDGSSRFGDKNKTHTFWSVAAGWIFSEEKWIKQNLRWLSFGKLRASYGITGNDQISDYLYLALYQRSQGINYQNVPGLQISDLSNPHVQWEDTHKRQWGLDLGFLNDRITLSASYNRNRSSNQITGYALPIMTGFSNIISNFPATIQNTSCEFILTAAALQRKGFQWTSSINFTLPRNKLVSFPNIENTPYGNPNYASGIIVGQPLGTFRGYRYAGVDPNTGDYLVFDKHGNTTSTPDDLEDLTTLLVERQEFYGGWQNNFTYKGIQLDFLFQFVYQKSPRDHYYYLNNSPGRIGRGTGNQPVSVLNRWQKPGDNAGIARFTTRSGLIIWPAISDAGYNYDASYIRLKNLSLSWQLPASWLSKTGLQNARLYLQGQNLATITNYTGLDPETRGLFLPPLQLWTVGIQVKL